MKKAVGKLWVELYPQLSSDGIILHVAHSEGKLQTHLQLLELPTEIRSRIHVIAVGAPGGPIPEELCGSVLHLCSKNDPITMKMREFAATNPTIKVLDPHPQASRWVDHTFLSPTYQAGYKSELREKMAIHETP